MRVLHLDCILSKLLLVDVWTCLQSLWALIIHPIATLKAPLDLDCAACLWRLLLSLHGGEVSIARVLLAHLRKIARIIIRRIIEGSVLGRRWALIVTHIDVAESLVDPGLVHLVGHLDADALLGRPIRVVLSIRESIRLRELLFVAIEINRGLAASLHARILLAAEDFDRVARPRSDILNVGCQEHFRTLP